MQRGEVSLDTKDMHKAWLKRDNKEDLVMRVRVNIGCLTHLSRRGSPSSCGALGRLRAQ